MYWYLVVGTGIFRSVTKESLNLLVGILQSKEPLCCHHLMFDHVKALILSQINNY